MPAGTSDPKKTAKNEKKKKKFFALAQKPKNAGPIKNKERSFFGGGAKNMSTIVATPFEIST